MFTEIPRQRPSTPLLDSIDSPTDLRQLAKGQLPELADQLRHYLLFSVGKTGGHFGAGLGTVELTLALHYVFHTPDDHLVWDVGHQCYPHKIITGRREQLQRIRKQDGLAPFPKREESLYDDFGVGHSSTSISAALGMAVAHHIKGDNNRTVAIIGDGAMTGGMAFEALNHAAHTHADMLVILNENDMSISPNIGGFATYLAKNATAGERTRASTTATMFEALDFHYTGPIDGHDLDALVSTLTKLREASGPQFLHIRTQKGKGFSPAEADPVGYHAITKLPAPDAPVPPAKGLTYSKVFGQWLCQQADKDPRLVAITPAMSEGSGMLDFASRFPQRFFDVAIAEQHCVTMAAGLACQGMKPIVAIYSTFLQRAYDQLIHDVALQKLDVLFAIDRAGLVGEDGPTHHGSFDLSFLSCIPNLVIMAPADEAETWRLLQTGYDHKGAVCIRYPRGVGPGELLGGNLDAVPLGQSRVIRQSTFQLAEKKVALLNFGSPLTAAREAAEKIDATLIDMRFVKPLDESRLAEIADHYDLLVTVEENALIGGAGSLVNNWLAARGDSIAVLNLGLDDAFVTHGKAPELLAQAGLDAVGIIGSVNKRLAKLG